MAEARPSAVGDDEGAYRLQPPPPPAMLCNADVSAPHFNILF